MTIATKEEHHCSLHRS